MTDQHMSVGIVATTQNLMKINIHDKTDYNTLLSISSVFTQYYRCIEREFSQGSNVI